MSINKYDEAKALYEAQILHIRSVAFVEAKRIEQAKRQVICVLYL